MSWSTHIYAYCERGGDPAFWAEPANALSNVAFLIAAGAGFLALADLPGHERGIARPLMVGLVTAIAIGSFLFHTYANRWSALGDVLPILGFILVYFAFALNRFLGVGAVWTLLLTLAYAGLFWAAMQLRCGTGDGLIGGLGSISLSGPGRRCLNGSIAYLPALGAIWVFAGLLWRVRHPAWRHLVLAGVIFAVSLAARTVDRLWCPVMSISGHPFGSHALWHLLNALTLFVLMRAAIRRSRDSRRPPLVEPDPLSY